MGRRVTAFSLAVVLVGGMAASAPGEKPVVVQQCNLAQSVAFACPAPRFDAGVLPRRLPRKEMAPVAVVIGAWFPDFGGESPPGFSEVTVELDRNTAVDAGALPACGKALLKTLNTGSARRRCRDSIVGSGTAHVIVPSFSSAPLPLPLTLFNGGVRGGTTTLLVHGFLAAPTREAIVAAVKVKRVEDGRYGLEAIAGIPAIAAGEGSLRDFRFMVGRPDKGPVPARRYAVARCFDDHLVARVEAVLQDDTRAQAVLARACTRGP